MTKLTPDQIAGVLAVVGQADKAVMAIYNSPGDLAVTTKPDNTPVTQADLAAHEIIAGGLGALWPEIPVVSEEGDEGENLKSLAEGRFWLVDPLDGTRTFIGRTTGHFTICLALIEEDGPTFGVISAPALDATYFGGQDYGSFRQTGAGNPDPLKAVTRTSGRVIISRTGFNKATEKYLKNHYPGHQRQTVGSQLKFARIAEGLADAYPRIGGGLRTWDIGAGQALVEGIGGQVVRPDGSRINYRAGDMRAGDFVASRPWRNPPEARHGRDRHVQ